MFFLPPPGLIFTYLFFSPSVVAQHVCTNQSGPLVLISPTYISLQINDTVQEGRSIGDKVKVSLLPAHGAQGWEFFLSSTRSSFTLKCHSGTTERVRIKTKGSIWSAGATKYEKVHSGCKLEPVPCICRTAGASGWRAVRTMHETHSFCSGISVTFSHSSHFQSERHSPVTKHVGSGSRWLMDGGSAFRANDCQILFITRLKINRQ